MTFFSFAPPKMHQKCQVTTRERKLEWNKESWDKSGPGYSLLHFVENPITSLPRPIVQYILCTGGISYALFTYVPEVLLMYFIWRCWFLNFSEENDCMGGVGDIQVRNVTLRTSGEGGGVEVCNVTLHTYPPIHHYSSECNIFSINIWHMFWSFSCQVIVHYKTKNVFDQSINDTLTK